MFGAGRGLRGGARGGRGGWLDGYGGEGVSRAARGGARGGRERRPGMKGRTGRPRHRPSTVSATDWRLMDGWMDGGIDGWMDEADRGGGEVGICRKRTWKDYRG